MIIIIVIIFASFLLMSAYELLKPKEDNHI